MIERKVALFLSLFRNLGENELNELTPEFFNLRSLVNLYHF